MGHRRHWRIRDGVAALPSLLVFARPGHLTSGSDFPFAAALESYPGLSAGSRCAARCCWSIAGRALVPGQNAFGQLGPAVFLDEMAGVDARMRLALGAGDMLDQR